MPKDGYTKFPNSILAFLSRARLGVLQMKMILAAVRNCHGFHKPDRAFGQRELRNWLMPYLTKTGEIEWDGRMIFKVAGRLVRRGIFLEHRGDKNKVNYRIQTDYHQWDLGGKEPVDNPVDKPVDSLTPGVKKGGAKGDSWCRQPRIPAARQPELFDNEIAVEGKLSTMVDLVTKKSLKKERKEEEDLLEKTDQEKKPALSPVVDSTTLTHSTLLRVTVREIEPVSQVERVEGYRSDTADERRRRLEMYKQMSRWEGLSHEEVYRLITNSSLAELETFYATELRRRA
jgi:hypothetical protein